MKNLKGFVLTLIIALALPNFAQAQSNQISEHSLQTLSKSKKFAMGVSGERQLKSAFKMYEKFKANDLEFDNFEIIIWGGVVKDLKKGSSLANFVQEHMHKGLKVSLCQIALEKFNLSKQDLPDAIEIVPDAYVRLFELNALEYNLIII